MAAKIFEKTEKVDVFCQAKWIFLFIVMFVVLQCFGVVYKHIREAITTLD